MQYTHTHHFFITAGSERLRRVPSAQAHAPEHAKNQKAPKKATGEELLRLVGEVSANLAMVPPIYISTSFFIILFHSL